MEYINILVETSTFREKTLSNFEITSLQFYKKTAAHFQDEFFKIMRHNVEEIVGG